MSTYVSNWNRLQERLMRAELTSRQQRIVACVARNTLGWRRPSHKLSASYVSKATGIDRRDVDKEFDRLEARSILLNRNPGRGKTPVYEINLHEGEWLPTQRAVPSTAGEGAVSATAGSEHAATAGDVRYPWPHNMDTIRDTPDEPAVPSRYGDVPD